jgi:hypothetical protein
MAARRIEAEWLDHLPADDPRAIASRSDLRRINGWMLHVGIMKRKLLHHCRAEAPRSLLDIGGGDGTFALRLARRLAPVWPAVTVTLVDRHDAVTKITQDDFAAIGWKVEPVAMDVFAFLEANDRTFDLSVTNLFLHHLSAHELTRLFALLAPACPMLVACEPRRAPLSFLGSRLLWAIGCNSVSRHDARVSVDAGFAGKELSAAWPDHSQWQLHESAAGLFTHCFVARRHDGSRDGI